jgi:hypothetical protein
VLKRASFASECLKSMVDSAVRDKLSAEEIDRKVELAIEQKTSTSSDLSTTRSTN